MKKTGCLLLAALLLLFSPAPARADRSRFLDAALSMLEEGNPFLVRYNAENGADIRALYPLGCPYFWGGRKVSRILEPASPDQESEYYHRDETYLYGLDCVGFTRWVMDQAGYAPHDAVSNLLNRSLYTEYVQYRPAKYTGEQRVRFLKAGDLGAVRHAGGGYHCILFIGTLLDFGYTEKNLPEELVPYLHYPLVIHCTGSEAYKERYRLFLEESGQADIMPPFGGVIVSLLDAPGDGYDLEGYRLETLDLSGEKQQRWLRWRKEP